MIGVLAATALSTLAPTAASARGSGGGYHGGFHGGGFHGGFGGAGLALGAVGLGLGLAATLTVMGTPNASYAYYGGGCYFVPRRAWTPWGWRIRRVEVCD
jgi:hypothetical protein